MEQELHAHFEYAIDLFDRTTIERLAGHMRVLLEGIAADPAARIGELPVLSAAERLQLVQGWNATASDYPRDKCAHELFVEQAAKTPNAVAAVYEGQQLSYGDLDHRSNQFAHYLRSIGVGSEVVVGLCVERSLDMLVGLVGILKAGGAYLPLDPSYPKERLAYMLADAGAPILVTHSKLIDRLPAIPARVVQIDRDVDSIGRCPTTAPRNTVLPDNIAYVIYTSGSTGNPKGVMGLHQGVVNRIAAQAGIAGFTDGEAFCQKTSIGFVDAVFEALGPLSRGLRLIVVSEAIGQTTEELAAAVARSAVTRVVTVPSLALALISEPLTRELLSGLQVWTLSGEELSGRLLGELSTALPNCRFVNLYGSSEVSADATY
jgi:non-ribosomal peptide synthetase component F